MRKETAIWAKMNLDLTDFAARKLTLYCIDVEESKEKLSSVRKLARVFGPSGHLGTTAHIVVEPPPTRE
jgi:hypothetical protein